jgi:hypothetical protein
MTDNVVTIPVRLTQEDYSDVTQFPLPYDLRYVALGYEFEPPRVFEDTEKSEEEAARNLTQRALDAMRALLRELDVRGGYLEDFITYSSDKYHCRVDIIATREDAELWNRTMFNLFHEDWDDKSSPIKLVKHKIMDHLPTTTSDKKRGFEPGDFIDYDRFAGCGWDADKAWPTLRDNWDMFETTVRAWAKTPAVDRFRQLKAACHDDLIAVGRMLARLHAQRTIGPVEFLVDGLLPKDNLILLLGAMEVGKSAWLLELACDTAMGSAEFMGRKLNSGSGLVAFVYGEDSTQEVDRRAKLICGGQLPPRLILIQHDGRSIKQVLEEEVGEADLDLLVIDPARKFYKGDEDSSDAANTFMNELTTFNKGKGAAMIAAHHLRRNSAPRTIKEVLASMRGSQMIADRPRVIVCMFRVGETTTIGIAKHNFNAAVMMAPPSIKLRRDATTFRHVPVESKTNDAVEGPTDVERVRAVLARLSAEDARVDPDNYFKRPPPGADALFKLDAPELADMSRAAVRDALHLAASPGRGRDPDGEGHGEGSSG